MHHQFLWLLGTGNYEYASSIPLNDAIGYTSSIPTARTPTHTLLGISVQIRWQEAVHLYWASCQGNWNACKSHDIWPIRCCALKSDSWKARNKKPVSCRSMHACSTHKTLLPNLRLPTHSLQPHALTLKHLALGKNAHYMPKKIGILHLACRAYCLQNHTWWYIYWPMGTFTEKV